MSGILRKVAQKLDTLTDSRAPVNLEGARPVSGVWEKKMDEFVELITDPPVRIGEIRAIYDLFRNSNSVGIDDRLLLLEKLIVLMSRYKDEEESKKCQQFVLSLLYKDLPHPPASYLAILPLEAPFNTLSQGRIKYLYRTADGSYTNPLVPSLGKAGTPYARSVSSSNIGPKATLPDPGLVFDTLLKRDKVVEHPGGISSLFFAFADLVIHSIFNTRHSDWTINDSSSYLDLSILYGSNENQQNSVRKGDGSGKLLDDVWADRRLTMMPPATCALLVLLNRNHNFIAQRLLDINENGNFVANPTDEKQRNLQDDEIFHRSRLVNCGYFMQIILGDYVGAILGLVRDETDWRLNPLMTMRDAGHEFCPTGQGNVVSIEFNLLYRWHATLSQPDSDWISGFFGKVFPGKNANNITISDFKAAADQRRSDATPPSQWKFGQLERDKVTNRFNDADLAKVIHDAIEARAGAFKARGIPECLRVIEMMGIQQARSWGTCSLNEFRRFLGLKPYTSFADWNPDPEIHTAAAALYRDIDNLEIHVGLQAEETKLPGPGAGLCPGYTISRAILADAVCLTRGDRFLTTDFNPYNLTAWGFQDCQFDHKDGSYGGLLTKLLFRTLPDYFPAGSAYAHFPFLDPKYMKDHMMKQKPEQAIKYTWTRPKQRSPAIPIRDFASVKGILNSPSYHSMNDNRIFATVSSLISTNTEQIPQRSSSRFTDKKNRYSISIGKADKDAAKSPVAGDKKVTPDDSKLKAQEKAAEAVEASKKKLITGAADLSKSIFGKPAADTASYFSKKTGELIAEKSFAKAGSDMRCVDIVKDVINYLPIHWISHVLGLPVKDSHNPGGIWREAKLTDMFADIAQYVYLDFSAIDDWKLRESSCETAKAVIDVIEAHVARIDSGISLDDFMHHLQLNDDYCHGFLKTLWLSYGKASTHREFAAQVFAAVVPTSSFFSQSLAHIVNFFLDENMKSARDDIVRLISAGDKESSTKALGYVYEALRLDPPIHGVYRTAAKDDSMDMMDIKTGSHVFASIISANRDQASFGPEPAAFDPSRAITNGGIISFGSTGFLTPEFFEVALLVSLHAILQLKSLERGPGKSGVFVRFSEDVYGLQSTQYIDIQGLITPWADSLLVQYTK